jgi:hypothetical protein
MIDGTGELISPAITTDGFETNHLRAEGVLHIGPGGPRFSTRTRVDGRPVHMTILFSAGRIANVEMVLLDGAGTVPYSDEPGLKREHEAWIRELTGCEPELVPLILDGRAIVPADPSPDHPRRVVLAWGECVSVLDSRSGAASIIVRYRQPR